VIQDVILKVLTVLSGALLLLFIAAPLVYPYGTFTHLDGIPSVIDHDWSQYGAMGWVYALGDILCHQEFSRSIVLNGSQMPVCGRDVGLLAGLFAGLIGCFWIKSLVGDRKYLIIGLILLLPTALEWIAEHVTTLDSMELRIFFGIISGIGAALIVEHVLNRNISGAEAP
jgi:uncharacterized membrane protein